MVDPFITRVQQEIGSAQVMKSPTFAATVADVSSDRQSLVKVVDRLIEPV